jgi:hypothetical protein
MIMRQYDSGSVAQYRWLETLARMHDRRGETADTHSMDTDHFVFLVEHQHNKVLPIDIGKVRM